MCVVLAYVVGFWHVCLSLFNFIWRLGTLEKVKSVFCQRSWIFQLLVWSQTLSGVKTAYEAGRALNFEITFGNFKSYISKYLRQLNFRAMFELSLILLSRPHFTRVSTYALWLGRAVVLRYGVIFPSSMSLKISATLMSMTTWPKKNLLPSLSRK